jgi:hypothetical protein
MYDLQSPYFAANAKLLADRLLRWKMLIRIDVAAEWQQLMLTDGTCCGLATKDAIRALVQNYRCKRSKLFVPRWFEGIYIHHPDLDITKLCKPA